MRLSELKDAGLPIAKITLCKTGQHTWIWTSTNTRDTKPPDKFEPCDCGRHASRDMWEYDEEEDLR